MSRTRDISVRFDDSSSDEIGRFILDRRVAGERGQAFFASEEAVNEPVVRHLFDLPAVEAVFLAENTVRVRKGSEVGWPELAPAVARAIREGFADDSSDGRPTDGGDLVVTPSAADKDHRVRPRERIPVAAELRMVVSWLLAGALVAQVMWATFWVVTDGSSAYPLRLAGTLAVLVLWIMFTRPAD